MSFSPVVPADARGALPLPVADSAVDLDAHRARRALDHPRRGLEFGGVDIRELRPGDRQGLLPGQLPGLLSGRFRRPLLDPDCLLDQVAGGWGLGDEGEASIFKNGDLGRDYEPSLRLGLLVVGAAELHDVDLVLAQGGPDRVAGSGLAGLDVEAKYRLDLLLAHA